MKVLWIVNTVFPFPSKQLGMETTVFGGWLYSLLSSIKNKKEINTMIVATTYIGKKLLKFEEDNVIYYLLPCADREKYCKMLEKYWKKIYNDEKPDLVHIHGTEYPHALSFINSCPSAKTCVSIQGLVSACSRKEYSNANIKWIDRLKNITLRDIIKRDLLIFTSKNFSKRGTYEKEIIRKCKFIIGRTSWDYINTYLIVEQDKYYACNESLRSSFYSQKWDISNIERHSIFISQASYPLKGIHNVIPALKLLLEKYPDLKVYISGNDVIKENSKFSERVKISGYGKYLRKMINKYNLDKVIIFTGLLDENQMVDRLLNSHVYLQTSFLENSSNSLGEAMILGLPCVASYVGGTADILCDKQEGFLYPISEPYMIVKYISNIFDNDNLALKIGSCARSHAKITHSLEDNADRIINIYSKIKEK